VWLAVLNIHYSVAGEATSVVGRLRPAASLRLGILKEANSNNQIIAPRLIKLEGAHEYAR
jgi:hypothetical protein